MLEETWAFSIQPRIPELWKRGQTARKVCWISELRISHPKIPDIPGGQSHGTEISDQKFSKNAGISLEDVFLTENSGKCCSICHWKFSKQGRLPCDEKFWYELSKSPALMDETCFQEFSGKEDNLPRCSKIFENFFIYGWMFLFSEIQQFPDFLKTCTGNFHTICPLFEIFGIFIWKESAPEFLIK